MLSKISQNLIRTSFKSKFLFKSLAPFKNLAIQPRFSFGTLPQKSSSLKALLSQQIKFEQDNKPELSQQLNYFKQAGWTVSHNSVQIMLSKTNGTYQIRILTNARTPTTQSQQDPQQQGQQEQEQQDDQDYAEVSTFISKDGKKWLCAQFMIVNSQCHLSVAHFIDNFQAEKAQRLNNKGTTAKYLGPQLGSLQSALVDNITQFLESVGIDNKVLINAADYSVSYEHKFYLEWLKSFESLC